MAARLNQGPATRCISYAYGIKTAYRTGVNSLSLRVLTETCTRWTRWVGQIGTGISIRLRKTVYQLHVYPVHPVHLCQLVGFRPENPAKSLYEMRTSHARISDISYGAL